MEKSTIVPRINTVSNRNILHASTSARKTLDERSKGIFAALLSAFFLGLTPVFGKAVILLGAPPLAVVALRTLFAALMLLSLMVLFYRPYLYIYPAGLLGCLLAGAANGLGSLFYYSALGRIDAGIGHLLYSLYPLFLVIWLALDRQPPTRLTLVRLLIAVPAIYLLTQSGEGQQDLIGVGQMLIASALFALHIPINQRVLYDMPAPTVTLYTLIAMSLVVVPVYLLSGQSELQITPQMSIPLIGLTFVTFISRLTLFVGVKHIGGMQTALLGLSELLVAVGFSQFWLGERYSYLQWIGGALLTFSLMLVTLEKRAQKRHTTGRWLRWLRPPGLPPDFPWQAHD